MINRRDDKIKIQYQKLLLFRFELTFDAESSACSSMIHYKLKKLWQGSPLRVQKHKFYWLLFLKAPIFQYIVFLIFSTDLLDKPVNSCSCLTYSSLVSKFFVLAQLIKHRDLLIYRLELHLIFKHLFELLF